MILFSRDIFDLVQKRAEMDNLPTCVSEMMKEKIFGTGNAKQVNYHRKSYLNVHFKLKK